MTEASNEERLALLLRNAETIVGEMVQRHPAALKQLRSRHAPDWIRDPENVPELAHVETERAARVVDWIAEGRDEGIFRTWREIRALVPGAPIPLFASYEAAIAKPGAVEDPPPDVEDGAPAPEDSEAERPGEAAADDKDTDDEARKPDRRQGRRRRPRPGAGEEE